MPADTRNPTPPGTTGPAAPGVKVKVTDRRAVTRPQPTPRHQATGQFRARAGGRRGQ
jgi:hypothetical protein